MTAKVSAYTRGGVHGRIIHVYCRRAHRLGRCYGHETVVYCAATTGEDLPMQTKTAAVARRIHSIKLILGPPVASLPTTTTARRGARFLYTHARAHAAARTPLLTSRYFSAPIFILSLV